MCLRVCVCVCVRVGVWGGVCGGQALITALYTSLLNFPVGRSFGFIFFFGGGGWGWGAKTRLRIPMGHALDTGQRVPCCPTQTMLPIIQKERLSDARLKELTKNYAAITFVDVVQPNLEKSIIQWHHYDLTFHKGWKVFLASNYKSMITTTTVPSRLRSLPLWSLPIAEHSDCGAFQLRNLSIA